MKTLFCVLNWGLGHASRSSVLIQRLIQEDHEVIIASDGFALDHLKKRFPDQSFLELPPYNVHYTSNNMIINMAFQSRKILRAIEDEHSVVSAFCKEHTIEQIISDNRYGCYHRDIPSHFLSHQLRPIVPTPQFIARLFYKTLDHYMEPFTSLWVPDHAPPGHLSGKLSTHSRDKTYTGFLSDLASYSIPKEERSYSYDIGLMLSGPEPTRSQLEERLTNLLEPLNHLQIVLVRGLPNKGPIPLDLPPHIHVYNHLYGEELAAKLNACKTLICRSGYSTLMDLLCLDIDALVIPTPGQTEQVYLAKQIAKKSNYTMLSQKELSHDRLAKALAALPAQLRL